MSQVVPISLWQRQFANWAASAMYGQMGLLLTYVAGVRVWRSQLKARSCWANCCCCTPSIMGRVVIFLLISTCSSRSYSSIEKLIRRCSCMHKLLPGSNNSTTTRLYILQGLKGQALHHALVLSVLLWNDNPNLIPFPALHR